MKDIEVMETIHIKHVGPLTDTGEIRLNRVMLLIGPQGAGKSTLMKILSFCRWVEKRIMQDESELKQYANYKRFIKLLKKFHHLSDTFFSTESKIVYRGVCIAITWEGGLSRNAQITKLSNFKTDRHNSKLSFIPAERNLASAIQNIDRAYRGNPGEDLLFNYLFELEEAGMDYSDKHKLKLSIGNDYSYYRSSAGQHFIEQDSINRSFLSYYASSGLQSVFPIDVISSYLINKLGTMPTFSIDDVFRIMGVGAGNDAVVKYEDFMEVSRKREGEFKYSSMHLCVEEPEQNLYPESQKELLLSLLGTITKAKDKETRPSSLVMTTHSPYLLSVMNVQMAKAWAEEEKMRNAEGETEAPSYNLRSWEFSAYYISKEGTLQDLILRGEDDEGQPIEFPMVDGTLLDSVSDDVNDELNDIYTSYYHG